LSLSVFYHPDFLNHDTGKGHPEKPDRLIACVSALESSDFAMNLEWKSPRAATEEELSFIHTKQHIEHIKKICHSGGGYLDNDTPVCSNSFDIALKSAGAWLDGVDEVINKNSAFVLSRPPGHHAEENRAMGFCLFSNAALAATTALGKNGVKRVCIFDWDVHHGNGTQSIVQNNPDIYYISTHQFPFYPGTGSQMETGKHNNVLNIPLQAGMNSLDYLKKFDEHVIPAIQKINPDLLIISSGFDAHTRDPLASINLETDDFAYMTRKIQGILPHLLVGLEGGYDLKALGECCKAVAGVLINNAGEKRGGKRV